MIPLLLLQTAAQPDTVVSIAARDGYDLVFMLAAAAALLVLVVTLLLVGYVLIQVRRATKAVQTARQRIAVDPAVESLRAIAKNLEAISRTMHDEVGRLSKSVSQVSDRLKQASDRMEERIEDFNAFLEVVQREAEETFVDGAATARGVRAGLGSLGQRPGSALDSPEAETDR